MREYGLFILLLSTQLNGFGQLIPTEKLESTRNKERVHYYDKKNKHLGCGFDIECRGFNIIFYKIKFNKSHSTLAIAGRTYMAVDIINKDTFPLNKVQVFTAEPRKEKLINSKMIGYCHNRGPNDTTPNIFPNRIGDFDFKVKVKQPRRLYFLHPGLFLIEYDINRLFKNNILP